MTNTSTSENTPQALYTEEEGFWAAAAEFGDYPPSEDDKAVTAAIAANHKQERC